MHLLAGLPLLALFSTSDAGSATPATSSDAPPAPLLCLQRKDLTKVVSRSAKSRVELTATADIVTPAFKLGDASIGLTTTSQSGDTLKVLNAKNITPLFQLARLKRIPWKPWEHKVTLANVNTFAPLGMKHLTPDALRMNTKLEGSLTLATLGPDD